MSEEAIVPRPGELEAAASPPPQLPDVNAETYPFDLVLHELDQAAYFNMLSLPAVGEAGAAITAGGAGGQVVGVRVHETLHRFDVALETPTLERGVRASDVVGEAAASFHHRWMMVPHDFVALPDREPPPTPLDPTRSQRFVMLGGVCRFAGTDDGFRGFGTGLTLPTTVGGESRLLVGAIGNVMEGFGAFAGHIGTYTYVGRLDPHRGFTGSLFLRVMDPQKTLTTDREIPEIQPFRNPEPGITYLLVRGQKRDKYQKTAYLFGPDGQPAGLDVHQQLRLFLVDFSARGRLGLCATRSVGQVVGKMSSKIRFNILDPGAPGTATAPIPFGAFNTFTFVDPDGRTLGSIEADGGEGRTFDLTLPNLPGQQALRFGSVGPLQNGTGVFAGAQGLMSDNSVVGVAPHALSTAYLFRLEDPDGRFRSRFEGAQG